MWWVAGITSLVKMSILYNDSICLNIYDSIYLINICEIENGLFSRNMTKFSACDRAIFPNTGQTRHILNRRDSGRKISTFKMAQNTQTGWKTGRESPEPQFQTLT
jgi:hypothetical protein